MFLTRRQFTVMALATSVTAACGGGDDAAATTGVRTVSPDAGAAIQNDPPADLVILDVRTAEEFNAGHLDGATMIDFYSPDFATKIAELDPDVPYLLYCRSGSRSGSTRALMQDLGFTNVADIEGGILAWEGSGLPTVTP